jgi:hypothetical protein
MNSFFLWNCTNIFEFLLKGILARAMDGARERKGVAVRGANAPRP